MFEKYDVETNATLKHPSGAGVTVISMYVKYVKYPYVCMLCITIQEAAAQAKRRICKIIRLRKFEAPTRQYVSYKVDPTNNETYARRLYDG